MITFLAIIGFMLLLPHIIKTLGYLVYGGFLAFFFSLFILVKGFILPFTLLKSKPWVWFVQIPLLLFYALLLSIGPWREVLPFVFVINSLIYVIIHNFYKAIEQHQSITK